MAASAGLSTPQIDSPCHTLPETAAGGSHAAPSSKPPKSNLHHHDDVWNEEATFALLQAWGTKFLELNHGGLSRADWSHVTQQVLLHSGKSSLTDTQCRNRIDTLKKKYKREKHKMATMGAGSSSWVYFLHMDAIINPTPKYSQPAQPVISQPVVHTPIISPPVSMQPAPIPIQATEHARNTDACMEKDENAGQDLIKNTYFEAAVVNDEDHGQDDMNMVSASCEPLDESGMSETSLNSSEIDRRDCHRAKRLKTDSASLRILAKALTKFADVYERIETAKLQHALDLEKAKMEATRNFEMQKWQLIMQTQMELAKFKEGADSFEDDMSANLFAACLMPTEYCLKSLQ